jgi:rare lipoprotein A (peptidoglycan hydrolase)
VRTRIIVAVAALMAASALVAVPDPAASRPPAAAAMIDSATLTAVTIPLSPGDAATTTTSTDLAIGPAERLGPGSAFLEPGARPVPATRPAVAQPVSRAGVFHKNYWRFDPDISWYGPGFYGSGTACGQEYTREILGVAHRSLPCGTMVTFRNTANGRQITVPVIDRGPYITGRTWDLSRALCEYLDHCYTGTIEWRWGGGGR